MGSFCVQSEGDWLIVSNAAVIFLSFVLAISFLLVILSCTLYSNYLPLLVGESAPVRSTLRFAHFDRTALIFALAPFVMSPRSLVIIADV